MAIWCEKTNRENVIITCPQDFENLVEPGVYSAMREYFEFDVIGAKEDVSNKLMDLENDLDDKESEIDSLKYEYECLEYENEGLKRLLKHITELAAETPETEQIREYLELHEEYL